MLSERLLNALNEQMNFEFESAQIYLAMAGYCLDQDLDGFANFFLIQHEEEKMHAMKFFNFINDKGGRITVKGFSDMNNDFSSILDVFEKAYQHEIEVTKRIYAVTDIAHEDREHATMSFLKWFHDEQVEEESTFTSLIKKVKMASENNAALLMLDAELGKRTLVAAE